MTTITPMMKQYLEIKENYSDAILFFRLGDFYEMFFEDAKVASKILEIALTGKSYGASERAPMCGVPFHSAESYIQKLVLAGKKVAICEQTEDPKFAKGIVKREVVQVITPGTNVSNGNLEGHKDSYLMGICLSERLSICYVDITTGELNLANLEIEDLGDFIYQVKPKEILIDQHIVSRISKIPVLDNFLNSLMENFTITLLKESDKQSDSIPDYLLGNLSIDLTKDQKDVLELVLGYIKHTQGKISNNFKEIRFFEENNVLKMDSNTKKNLELVENATSRQKKNSLFDFLDYTYTSIGKRLLRKWIENPLNQKAKINHRLDLIEELNSGFNLRQSLGQLLEEIYDLERITAKFNYGRLSTKDLVALRGSLGKIPEITREIRQSELTKLTNLISNIDELSDIYKLLDQSIVEEPDTNIKDGVVIKSEFNEALAQHRYLESNTAKILQDLEQKEKQNTGIKGLKIGYNKVFGYYFEITRAALKEGEIPNNYIRKQTLANAERFINEDLKILEEKILGARQKIYEIQSDIFEQIRDFLSENTLRINRTADVIGQIDALLSLSIASLEDHMTRPQFNEEGEYKIIASRHPVIEKIVGEVDFVPNDIFIDKLSKIQIITGPNMGGKSTYMRQAAIISIMAHMGSFVTAKSADLPILDAIYTRIGASDDLSLGQSTFMVEMKEVSYILKNATSNSLIILDEVGRGTSTFDGLSIAWAIIEYIAKNIRCSTMFSTHYHEITDLEDDFPNIKNYFIAVDDSGENISFMHKVMPGKMDKSYGIHVAKLAGLPQSVLQQANEKLNELELVESRIIPNPKLGETKQAKVEQISFEDLLLKELKERIQGIELDNTTPREAFNILEELIQSIGGK